MSATRGRPETNSDLIWSLNQFDEQELAQNFVARFESRLCVYSPSVEKVYTNYSMNFPSSHSRKMVVLPNPYAFHDTFNNIPPSAVRDTGLFIVPGAVIGKSGLFVIVKGKNQTIQHVPLPMRHALKKMLLTDEHGDPFLPILIKGDLREFDARTPCLHLHRLKLAELTKVSAFDKQNIKNVIFSKIDSLYQNAEEIAEGF